MRFFRCVLTALILSLSFISLANADIAGQLKKDFSSLSGLVIMPVGNEYLIDLDSTSSLAEGDILTFVSPGEKIIHPVSKEVLGALDEIHGFLQVTRLQSGYSYAKLLSSDVPLKKGDSVKRFEQVPATIMSNDPALSEQLKQTLPQLNWLSDSGTEAALLTFEIKEDSLLVTTADGASVRTYTDSTSAIETATEVAPLPTATPTKSEPKILQNALEGVLGNASIGKDIRLENPGIIRSQQIARGDLWLSPNLKDNPIGMITADLDGDGQLEIAVAYRNSIAIYRMTSGDFDLLDSIEFPGKTKLLSIDSIDLTSDGREEIYLTAANDYSLYSQCVEYINGHYERSIKGIDWYLRVVENPHQGKYLVGQKAGNKENFFAGSPFKVQRNGDKLVKGDDISLPFKANMFSFNTLVADDGSLLTFTSNDDHLYVATEEGDELWDSAEKIGGTEEFFYIAPDKNSEMVPPTYIGKRILSLGAGQVLALQNEGTRALERYRDFDGNNLTALKWDGKQMQELWKTAYQSGYLADFAVADADNDGEKEIVMAIRYKSSNVLQRGRSNIVIIEMP